MTLKNDVFVLKHMIDLYKDLSDGNEGIYSSVSDFSIASLEQSLELSLKALNWALVEIKVASSTADKFSKISNPPFDFMIEIRSRLEDTMERASKTCYSHNLYKDFEEISKETLESLENKDLEKSAKELTSLADLLEKICNDAK